MISLMQRGDVWLVNLDPAIGTEVQKTRPAVIVSNDFANRNSGRVTVVPVTSAVSKVFPVESLVEIQGRTGKTMCDQIRAVDKSRLIKLMAVLSPRETAELEHALAVALALPI
jgi:mRNA interferase MazF